MPRLLPLVLLLVLALPARAQESDVRTVVDDPPELIGGLEGLAQQIEYPLRAKLAGIEGRVFVQFVVEKDGSVTEAEIVKGVEGGGLNEEALRVVRAARFTPGRHESEPVRVRFALPIVFALPDAEPAGQ